MNKEAMFSKRLREAIDRRGLKQKSLAAAIGVTRNTLSRYLMGERMPHATTVQALANHLGVAAEYLLGSHEGIPTNTSVGIVSESDPPYTPDAVSLVGLDVEERRTVLRMLEALRSGDAEVRQHLIGQLKIIQSALLSRRQQPRAEERDGA